ncbi:MAG: UvrD-helicase domain-containing protein [Ignavibacteria bacterium]
MNNSISLSEDQQKIVYLTKGKHLVLAPPGTGKTELLSHRILFALENGVKPEEMVCLTFTNRAAKTMKERVEKYVNNCNVFIGNIHSFCQNFLHRNQLIPQATVLLDEEDSSILIKEILDENGISLNKLGYNIKIEDILRLNSYFKQISFNFLQKLIILPRSELLLESNKQLFRKVCLDYENLKGRSNYIDFDDLLNLTYVHLMNPTNFELQKYSWVQIDEIQDLNSLQIEIIKLISTNDAHFVFFGDFEQSIFSFLGANPHNLIELQKECQLHTLHQNYRSPSYLLNIFVDFALSYLKPNWTNYPVSGLNDLKPDGALKIFKVRDNKIQNRVIVNLLNDLTKEDKSQTAILVRTNQSVKFFSDLLNTNKIQHFKVSHFDLFRTSVIKDIMAFLNCLIDEHSRLNWSRILKIFGKMNAFKEARKLINDFYDTGLYPSDFLKENFIHNELKHFNEVINNKRVILFDTETTGFSPEEDDIIQIAAIEIINGKEKNYFNRYLKTDKDLSKTKNVHKITDNVINIKGEDRKKVLQEFLEFINGDTIVAHNINFDLEMLIENCKRLGIKLNKNEFSTIFDTLSITRRIYPSLKSYNLEFLINQFRLNAQNTHNALDDVKATFELIKFLLRSLDEIIEKQKIIILNNQLILERFVKNFSPLWNKIKSEFNTSKKISEVILSFIEELFKNFKYYLNHLDQENLSKLLKHMHITCNENTLEKNLKKYVPLYETLKEPDLVIGDEKIVISTIHRAKGLEFINVIIPECNLGVFPYGSSKDTGEDARTFYVAMTRAKKRLIFISNKGSISPYLNKIENYFEIIEID